MISEKAFAKLNLSLLIKGKTSSHHLLDMLNQSIALCDEVTVTPRADNLITSNIVGDNSIVAVRALSEKYNLGGFDINVKKNIPVGAGLGGSSADASACVKAICKLAKFDLAQVYDDVKGLFGDIAFELVGGSAHCTGIGDEVRKLAPLPKMHVLIAYDKAGVSTKSAFELSDTYPCGIGDTTSVYNALMQGKCAQNYYKNDLFEAAKKLNPKVAEQFALMQDKNALLVGMSGSGSAIFALYTEKTYAEIKAKSLPFDTILTETLDF